MSSWLTVLPIAKLHFDLTAQEFCDVQAICYKKPYLEYHQNVMDVVLLLTYLMLYLVTQEVLLLKCTMK